MQGESMRVVGFDRRRPNLRLKLTAPSIRGIVCSCMFERRAAA